MSIRVTFRYTVDDAGKVNTFSEIYWYVPTVTTLDVVVEPAKKLVEARLKLSGVNVRATSIRISRDGVNRDMRVMYPYSESISQQELAYSFPGSQTPVLPTQTSDQPKACLQIRQEQSSSIYRNVYMAGMPDVILRTQPAGPDVAAHPAWATQWNKFAAILAPPEGGAPLWGFRARNPREGEWGFQEVLNYGTSVDAPQRKYAVVVAGGPAIALGAHVQITGVTTLTAVSSLLNDTWKVTKVDSATEPGKIRYELYGSETVDLSVIDNAGKIAKVGFNYWPISRVQIVGQTTRKRGASGDRLHGRRSRRKKRV